MHLATNQISKMIALAAAISLAGGCVSAKMNLGDEVAIAAPVVEESTANMMVADSSGSSGVSSYTVAQNDNLWCISKRDEIYGTPYNWPLIYKANAGQIKDADLIYAGQMLDIPRDSSQGDIDAAVQHAKSRGAWAVGPIESTDTVYLGG